MFYAMECLNLSAADIKMLNSCQGEVLKRVCGFNKRSHHSKLLDALNISRAEEIIKTRAINLYRSIFIIDSPAKRLNILLLSRYLRHGLRIKGTLLDRVISSGTSPVLTMAGRHLNKCTTKPIADGVTDSLRLLIYSDQFNCRSSGEHVMASLLLKSF